MSDASPTGRPGRYQRSAGGLVGAMIVLVLVVIGFVLYRGAFRDTPEYEPEHLDYRELIGTVQRSGVDVVYPARLPDGWFAKNVEFTPGRRPVLDLALTTDNGRFAGVHQEDASVNDLVEQYVDPGAAEGKPVHIRGSVAPTWQTFSDAGGDHAFAAEVGGDTVLVYGSASESDLRELVESLTTRSLGSA